MKRSSNSGGLMDAGSGDGLVNRVWGGRGEAGGERGEAGGREKE